MELKTPLISSVQLKLTQKTINDDIAVIRSMMDWNHLTDAEIIMIAIDSMKRDVKELRGYSEYETMPKVQ